MSPPLWVFGYGSLIWRPAFEFAERRPAAVQGFRRRFWQASMDHRGTPDAPGRVVTLLPEEGEWCEGAAYRVHDRDRDEVLRYLDVREIGGYERHEVELRLRKPDHRVSGLVYIATPDNPNYVGPTPVREIAEIARTRVGPSGSNREYVLNLAAALQDLGAKDDHVETLAELVAAEEAA